MELPPCANFREGTCERSQTFVAKETDDAYVIGCRTCKSINVFPKDLAEKSAKYSAFLKMKSGEKQAFKVKEHKQEYSIPGAR